MFQLKTKITNNGLNPVNTDPKTALPNNYGHVRTLKEDYENFVAGKSGNDETQLDNPPANPSPPFQAEEEKPSAPALAPPAPTPPASENIPSPFSSATPQKEENLPSPLGSQTFYNEKSPFDDAGTSDTKSASPASAKPKNTLVIISSVVLAILLLGGGFYYYWFFIKSPVSQTSSEVPTPATNQNTTPAVGNDQQNDGMLRLVIDTESGEESAKPALQKIANDFQNDSSSGDLAEIKVLDKNNAAVSPKGLSTALGFSIPEKINANISDEYSLFVKNENSQARMGAAFKLSDSTGLTDYLSLQEATLSVNLSAFYLDQIPSGAATSFSSSRYNNADIRYFNFPSPENTSFDYSIITSDQNGYFIFATSKGTMRSILDYMSKK